MCPKPTDTTSSQVRAVVPAAVLLLATALLSVLVGVPPAGATATTAWRLPLEEATVIAAFDPPRSRYGVGHRGVDLVGGVTVTAPAPGTVAFVGMVAGERWLTLDHVAGLRTSYGPLSAASVARGDAVAPGDVLGQVGRPHGGGPGLHWSARRGGTYLDPMTLLGTYRPALVGPGGWEATDVAAVARYEPWDGEHRFGIVPSSPRATGPGYVLPPNPNHVVAIAGLSSRTGEPPFDVTHLGYDAVDVTEFSYAGGDGRGGQASYGPPDTWEGVDAAAARLEEQLRAQWADHPGQAVDLVGHSMGGVVALWYLLTRHDPADQGLPPIGHIVTIASPLQGADIADGLTGAATDPRARALLIAIGAAVGEDPVSQAVRDLTTTSPITTGIGEGWGQAVGDVFAGPLATGTQVLTIGAEVDLIVPEHRSDLPGTGHVVLPGGHDGVRHSEAVRQVVHAFLADEPVPGEDGGLGSLLSHPIGWVERATPGLVLPG